jgi:hypothetical protein
MKFFTPENAAPTSMMDVMIPSLLFAFFGVMMFVGSVRYEMTYGKSVKWWWSCLIPLGLATIFGIQKVVWLQDPFYMQTVLTRKQQISHYGSLVIPVLCIAAIFLYRRRSQMATDRKVY